MFGTLINYPLLKCASPRLGGLSIDYDLNILSIYFSLIIPVHLFCLLPGTKGVNTIELHHVIHHLHLIRIPTVYKILLKTRIIIHNQLVLNYPQA